MVRRLEVSLVMLAVIAAVAVAGIMNYRSRRAAVEAAHVELVPATPGATEPTAADGPEGMQLQGKSAPAFTLVSTAGKKVSLSDFKGKPVVVNFWATWCGPCKLEMPWFEEFSKKYAPQGLVVLGLNQDEDGVPSQVAQVAKTIGVSYPVLMQDKDEHVAKAYGGVDYLPETFYLDREGKVTAVTAGAPTKDAMEHLIQVALNGK